ncbi:MAG: hypothetical protein QOI50_2032 [Pseudonocardiales bacterium]|jgi:hypothetical protein|nr:hypothetical protein [Pseudonocardiales bacterium]MDT7630102.1 hypothetical protein [Pseudonocardiales bacterium]MDT7640129.1 hypothetical protein [Pseudonocardiales bacterium]MDT7682019.1 hypothetical protein [Pseudonocardiales bacterium]
MSDSASSRNFQRQDHVITMLVGLALDDLESGNIDVETALRFVAHRAWVEGHREGVNAGNEFDEFVEPLPPPIETDPG